MFDAKEGNVVGMRGCQVSDFNGRSLNCGDNVQVYIEPSHQRTVDLLKWYNSKDQKDFA